MRPFFVFKFIIRKFTNKIKFNIKQTGNIWHKLAQNGYKRKNSLFRTFDKSNKIGDIINVNNKDLATGKDLMKIE